MPEHFGSDSRALNNTAVGSEVAPENSDSACGAVGIVNGSDNLGIAVYNALNILRNGLAGAGDKVVLSKPSLLISFITA